VADDETGQIWYKLLQLVRDFTGRKLTIPGDAYDAFATILQQFRILIGEHFLWGLPAARFELGLCWEPRRQGLKEGLLDDIRDNVSKASSPFSIVVVDWLGAVWALIN
jgi:hypothetical protein